MKIKLITMRDDPFGIVYRPDEVPFDLRQGGIGRILNIFIYILIIGGGIYALFNFILAGYAFLGAGDDPKKIESAWAKIYQSIIGLVFMAGSFVIAAIIGMILFGNARFILSPTIPTAP